MLHMGFWLWACLGYDVSLLYLLFELIRTQLESKPMMSRLISESLHNPVLRFPKTPFLIYRYRFHGLRLWEFASLCSGLSPYVLDKTQTLNAQSEFFPYTGSQTLVQAMVTNCLCNQGYKLQKMAMVKFVTKLCILIHKWLSQLQTCPNLRVSMYFLIENDHMSLMSWLLVLCKIWFTFWTKPYL